MLAEKAAVYDARIEELSHTERYEGKVQKLCCFKSIATHIVRSLLVEVGDYNRFHFASYLGLVPGESSGGEKQVPTRIAKVGNSHLRWLLVEDAQVCSRGAVRKKGNTIKARQNETLQK